MRELLLEILAEPGTGSRLRLEGAKGSGDRIDEGRLVSEQTGRTFPIVRGIPRFVEGDTYADSFGLQWNKFRGVQVDSATGGSHSRQRFDAEAGWTRGELEGKWLLDAGCGAGRFAEVAAARGPNLVALDFSSAVEAARETLAPYPNADVVQASLLEPPFRDGTFDFAYCIGVVQHTPAPQEVVRRVVRLVRPQGRFCFTIYGRKPWSRLHAKYWVRPITRRLPQPVLLKAIEAAMPVLFPATDLLYRLPVIGRVARFTIPVANYPERTEFSREQRYQESILDTFDVLSPRYDSPLNQAEVEESLRDAGATSWEFRPQPINVVGVR